MPKSRVSMCFTLLLSVTVLISGTNGLECECYKQFVSPEPPASILKSYVPTNMDINKICPSGKCLTGDKCARGSISFMGYSGTVGFCNVTDSIIDQITKATGVSNLGVCDGTNSQKPGICTCSSTSCNPKPTDLSFLSTKSNSFGNPTFYQQKSNGTCSKLSYRLFLLALVLSLFKLHK